MASELDLTPDAVDVRFYQGDGRTITLTWPNTVDLTAPARTFTAKVRTSKTATTSVGTLTPSVATHSVVFTPDAALIALAAGVYYYDIQYTIASGNPVTVMTGRWQQVGDVTR